MVYTHIIWDFNGTLLNDVKIAMLTMNTLLKRRNMKTMDSVADYHNVFIFPIIEYYNRLGFDLTKEKFNDIAEEWVEQYLKNCDNAPLYDGAVEVLSKIRDKGIPQIILSATEKEILTIQVKQLGIKDCFNEILGLDNIHAYSKVYIAKDWYDAEAPQRAVLIGDSLHDYEVAQALGIECILIANGHQSKAILQGSKTLVIDDIRELINILEL
jgi:phosphoglycolate phosphatase